MAYTYRKTDAGDDGEMRLAQLKVEAALLEIDRAAARRGRRTPLAYEPCRAEALGALQDAGAAAVAAYSDTLDPDAWWGVHVDYDSEGGERVTAEFVGLTEAQARMIYASCERSRYWIDSAAPNADQQEKLVRGRPRAHHRLVILPSELGRAAAAAERHTAALAAKKAALVASAEKLAAAKAARKAERERIQAMPKEQRPAERKRLRDLRDAAKEARRRARVQSSIDRSVAKTQARRARVEAQTTRLQERLGLAVAS